MMTLSHSGLDAKILLRGIHVRLNDATKALASTKAERLLRHEPRILRVRIDVIREVRGRNAWFTAQGRVELAGPDLAASITTDSAEASITLLVDKLDRMLRKRTSNLMRRRTSGDIRAHAEANAIE